MPRRIRQDKPGACYHVLNRGNQPEWIFQDERAKEAFERTLFEACERAGWKLHAFGIMSNNFHLAVETPVGNLSEGMRWLQAVFALRANSFRHASGKIFQGRFKSLTVENPTRLAWLSHYIHLNPVRAGLCPVDSLSEYRWSSHWYLARKSARPPSMQLGTCLAGAGGLKDTPTGHRKYGEYLAWLQEDEVARQEMAFGKMSKGWAIGSKDFRKELARDDQKQQPKIKRTQAKAKRERETRWAEMLKRCLAELNKTKQTAAREPKSAPWKVGTAALMKTQFMITNGWLATHLHMGTDAGVSRYVTETNAGERPAAAQILKRLITKIKP